MREAGFQEFFEILRSGDAEAVERLLSDFDPFLRRAIRLRLCDRRAAPSGRHFGHPAIVAQGLSEP